MAFDPKLHAARRARVFEEMERRGGGVMVLPAADEKQRNADDEYLFRQDSDYAWAIGLDEPMGGAVLLARGGERKLVLFVRPRDPEKEIWNGRRVGVEGAKERLGADEAFPVAELDAKLAAMLEGAPTLWWRLGQDPAWDVRMARVVAELRALARTGKRAPGTIVEPGPDPARAAAREGAGRGREAPARRGDHRRGPHGGDARRLAGAARAPGAGGDRVRLPAARRDGPGLRHHRRVRRELDHPPLPRRATPCSRTGRSASWTRAPSTTGTPPT